MSASSRKIGERPQPTLQVGTAMPDPRRVQLNVDGAAQAGPVDIEAGGTTGLLIQNGDFNYVGETAGGDVAVTLHTGVVSSRARVHRNPFTGASFYAVDVSAAGQTQGLLEGSSGVGVEGTAGVGLMRPFGGLANGTGESRLLPFSRVRGFGTLELGDWSLSGDVSADAIFSLGVPGGAYNSLDSTELGASVALDWQRRGYFAGAKLAGAVGYANPHLYLTEQSLSGLGGLDVYGEMPLSRALTLSGRVHGELLATPDADLWARTHAMVSLSHARFDANIFGGVDSYQVGTVGAGVGVKLGRFRLGFEGGAANDGERGFAPQGMLTLGVGAAASSPHASEQALAKRAPRTNSARNSSYAQLISQVERGDVAAMMTLQDLQGIYGWVGQTDDNGEHTEQSAQQTMKRGSGDCSDQGVLWTYLFNKHGKQNWDTWLFSYQHDGANSGHAFAVLRHKKTGRVYVSEYGSVALLQNVPVNATDAQIAELVRTQSPDAREALGAYELMRGAVDADENYYAIPTGIVRGRSPKVSGGVVAVPLRGAGTVLGRDRVFGHR